MSFALIQGGQVIGPQYPHTGAMSISNANISLTTAAAQAAVTLKAPKTGTLHSFELRLGNVTQAPTNGLRFAFQGGTSTGNPDTTDDQYRVVASGITANTWLVPPGPLTNDGTDTGTKRSVLWGETVCCVVKYESFVAGDNLTIATLQNQSHLGHHARTSSNSGASWTRQSVPMCFVLRYEDGYEFCIEGMLPATAVNSSSLTVVTTPDEWALRFELPFDSEVMGIRLPFRCSTEGGELQVRLYTAGDTVLDDTTVISGEFAAANTQVVPFIPLQRTSPLAANTPFRVGLAPLSGTWTFYDFTVPSQDYLRAVPGGEEMYLSTRTDAGAWTDDGTRRPFVLLYLSRIDAVVGGERGGSYCYIG